MAKIELIRIQNLCDDFSRFDQPRSGPVKEMMAVDEVNSCLLNRAQIRPRRIFREQFQIADRLRNLESARDKKDELRGGLDEARPLQPGRMFAGLREKTGNRRH